MSMYFHLQDVVDATWSNKDSDGVDGGHLETLYCIPRYIQDAVFTLRETDSRVVCVFSSISSPFRRSRCTHLVGDLFDGLYAGSIQMVVVLSGLYELVLLDLLFHELSGGHEVVVSAVHLVVSPRPRCV